MGVGAGTTPLNVLSGSEISDLVLVIGFRVGLGELLRVRERDDIFFLLAATLARDRAIILVLLFVEFIKD